MAHWEAYFDESGDEDYSRVFAMGGYLVRSDKAQSMQVKWKEALKRADNVPFFHAADCNPDPGNGVFKGVSRDKRIALQTELINLVKDNMTFGLCFLINPQRLKKPTAEKSFEDAYTVATRLSLSFIVEWVRRNDPYGSLSIIYEAGHASESMAKRAIYDEFDLKHALLSGEPAVAFAGKRQVCLLQAGDLIAWHAAKYVKNLIEEKRGPRKDFMALMELPHLFRYLSAENREFNDFRDWRPQIQDPMKVQYVRCVFGEGADADEQMKKVHAMYDALGLQDRETAIDKIMGAKL